jgi:Flp pilus assembly protein TadG
MEELVGDFSTITGKRKYNPYLLKYKKGQALVELVMVLPILLLLVISSIEMGRVFFAKIVITNAAREGAFYLSSNASDASVCSGSTCFQGTRTAIKNESNNSGVTLSDTNLTISCTVSSSSCKSGSAAIVTIQTSVNNVYIISLVNKSLGVNVVKNSFAIKYIAQMVVQ